jgi:diguanylate cyclase (GGDEF)-like protein
MYDPLVVDTFLRVHTQIIPSERPSAFGPSLRAITEAANLDVDSHVSAASLDEISASTDEMLTLFDLAKSLSPSMHVADVADIITKHIRRLIPSSLSVFYLFDPHADELVATHIAGEPAGVINGLRIARGQRLSGWVAANRQTIRNSDPVLDFGESARSMSPRPRSCLSTALVDKDDLVGVLTLYSTNRDGFSVDHERIIEIVSRQVAGVLRHASEFQNMKAVSLRDPLTGLPNVEQFLKFSRSAEESSGDSAPAALLLIDIDNLRQIDSTLGREAGNAALSTTVEATRRVLRPTDVLFRDDNDQLIAVLLHTNEATGEAISGRLAAAIRDLRERSALAVSVSTALAVTPRDGRTFEMLLQSARRRVSGDDGETTFTSRDQIH